MVDMHDFYSLASTPPSSGQIMPCFSSGAVAVFAIPRLHGLVRGTDPPAKAEGPNCPRRCYPLTTWLELGTCEEIWGWGGWLWRRQKPVSSAETRKEPLSPWGQRTVTVAGLQVAQLFSAKRRMLRFWEMVIRSGKVEATWSWAVSFWAAGSSRTLQVLNLLVTWAPIWPWLREPISMEFL